MHSGRSRLLNADSPSLEYPPSYPPTAKSSAVKSKSKKTPDRRTVVFALNQVNARFYFSVLTWRDNLRDLYPIMVKNKNLVYSRRFIESLTNFSRRAMYVYTNYVRNSARYIHIYITGWVIDSRERL